MNGLLSISDSLLHCRQHYLFILVVMEIDKDTKVKLIVIILYFLS